MLLRPARAVLSSTAQCSASASALADTRGLAAAPVARRSLYTLFGGARTSQILATRDSALSPSGGGGVRSFSVTSNDRVAHDPRLNNPKFILHPRCGKWQEDLYRMGNKSLYRKMLCKLWGQEFHAKFLDQPYYDIITICCDSDYKGFLKVCGLEDTFASWFLVYHMHMWMYARRIHQEGVAGAKIGYSRFWRLCWEQVELRMVEIKKEHPGIRQKKFDEVLKHYGYVHYTNSLMYEKAIHSSDLYLAKALGYTIFDKEECVTPEALLIVVNYWREQVAMIDSLPPEDLFIAPSYSFPPLIDHPDVEPVEKKKARLLLLNGKVDHDGWIHSNYEQKQLK